MEIHELDDAALSAQAEISPYVMKRILTGETDNISLRHVIKLSKVFKMSMNLFIDFISL
jgi:plasmid maintenance system antidote protein VapI